VPATALLSVIGDIIDPEQMVCAGVEGTTLGVGFTSTVAETGVPVQPLAVGVMVKVMVTGAVVVFVNRPAILPVPLAAMPVTGAVLFLVQLKLLPATRLLNEIVVIDAPEQMV
jgi:hypothetical protein